MPNFAGPALRAAASTRASSASLWSENRPRQPCVMRPCRSTCVASMTTSPAPEFASCPRWIRCQSLAQPSSAEYWHIGETAIRLGICNSASESGENNALLMMTSGKCAVRNGSALLDGFQIGDDGTDIVGLKAVFRHGRMARHDAFGQRLFQRFDRVPLAERAEGGRLLQRALAGFVGRVAFAAILLQQGLALREIVGRRCRSNQGCEQHHDRHE